MRILEVKNVSFSYDGKFYVLENVSFSVEKGDFVGIVGPNGAGKSTLFKLILGFMKPNKGSIELFGKKVENFREWKKVGYVPQRINVEHTFPGRVAELLSSVSDDKTYMEFIVEYLKIKDILNKQFTKLSGGQQQRVMLALALTTNPDLLLLDEPSTGLDVHALTHFTNILIDLNTNHGKTILMISHDIGNLLNHANKILCINKRVCYFGPPENAIGYIEEAFGLKGVLHGIP